VSILQTGMIASLRLVYSSHGGLRSIFRSGYFWFSGAMTTLCWPSIKSETWANAALSSLPTLAGFSIAAYAILFAVLDERSRRALSAPEPDLDNRSPLLIIVGVVTHAVVTQVLTLLYAFTFEQKPLPPSIAIIAPETANHFFSALGLFLFVYSVILILASILTLFRVLEIRTRV